MGLLLKKLYVWAQDLSTSNPCIGYFRLIDKLAKDFFKSVEKKTRT
jgi:hypothetical protein